MIVVEHTRKLPYRSDPDILAALYLNGHTLKIALSWQIEIEPPVYSTVSRTLSGGEAFNALYGPLLEVERVTFPQVLHAFKIVRRAQYLEVSPIHKP